MLWLSNPAFFKTDFQSDIGIDGMALSAKHKQMARLQQRSPLMPLRQAIERVGSQNKHDLVPVAAGSHFRNGINRVGNAATEYFTVINR